MRFVQHLDLGANDRVLVAATPERFHGITYSEDLAAVKNEMASLVTAARYPSPLWP